MEETKIIYEYHLDPNERILITIPLPADRVTLRDFKQELLRHRFTAAQLDRINYFFQTSDPLFETPVRERIRDDNRILPHLKGRIVAWLEAESHSIARSSTTALRRAAAFDSGSNATAEETATTQTSVCSSATRSQKALGLSPVKIAAAGSGSSHNDDARRTFPVDSSQATAIGDALAEMLLDSSNYDTPSAAYSNNRRTQLAALRASTVIAARPALDIAAMDVDISATPRLGIAGMNEASGGLLVTSVERGGAIDADGRIVPGDVILQANQVDCKQCNGADTIQTVATLAFSRREERIRLVVAKASTRRSAAASVEEEPVRKIEVSAWVRQTQAAGAERAPSPPQSYISELNNGRLDHAELQPHQRRSNGSALPSPSVGGGGGHPCYNPECHTGVHLAPLASSQRLNLTSKTGIDIIAAYMRHAESGIQVADRQWLKVTIRQAFLGSDLLKWLQNCVGGLRKPRDARNYANKLLALGFIVSAIPCDEKRRAFSEQRYYRYATCQTAALEVATIPRIHERHATGTYANPRAVGSGPNGDIVPPNRYSSASPPWNRSEPTEYKIGDQLLTSSEYTHAGQTNWCDSSSYTGYLPSSNREALITDKETSLCIVETKQL